MASAPSADSDSAITPLEGAVYVFRNRSGTALKLLLYDGQGYLAVHEATLAGPL